jgi:hypothetical protein
VVDWVEFDLESEDADTMDFFSRWLWDNGTVEQWAPVVLTFGVW